MLSTHDHILSLTHTYIHTIIDEYIHTIIDVYRKIRSTTPLNDAHIYIHTIIAVHIHTYIHTYIHNRTIPMRRFYSSSAIPSSDCIRIIASPTMYSVSSIVALKT